MRRIRAVALVLILFGSAVAQSQQPPAQDQAPQIGPYQKAADALKSNPQAEQDKQQAAYCSFLFPQSLADNGCPETSEDKEQIEDERSEYWSISGHRLKITDTLLVVFTGLLFVATWRLWVATNRLAKGAEETAKAQLRAYVGWVNAIHTRVTDHGTDGWDFQFEFRNDGQTPAKNVTRVMEYHFSDRKYPSDYVFPDLDRVKSSDAGVLSGGDSFFTSREPITKQQILDVFDGKNFLYVYGWIEYDDIFYDTPKRRTEFCRMVVVRRNPRTSDDVGFFYAAQTAFNAMDGDCAYPAAMRKRRHSQR